MSDAPNPNSAEFKAARKRRNLIIALSVAAFVVLVFVVTIVRMGGAV